MNRFRCDASEVSCLTGRRRRGRIRTALEGTVIRKWITLFGGSGALLIGGGLSALPSLYPNQVSRHPRIVVGSLIAGCVLFLVEGIVRAMGRPEKQPAIAAPQAQANATGNQLTVNVHPTPPSGPAAQPPIPTSSVLPRPHFDIHLTRGLVEAGETVVRFVESGGEKCLALRVLNRPAQEGKQARRAQCVFAMLEFTASSSSTSSLVNRACWINKESHDIAIGVGETEHILVGLPAAGDEWVTYNNPNRVNLQMREHWDPTNELERRTINWGDGASYIVDVRIISNDFGPTLGETFAHRQFKLERKGIAYSAEMLETKSGVTEPRKTVTEHPGRTLVVASPEDFAIEIEEHESGDAKGLMFRIRNDRLVGIARIKLTIYTAQSFDSRHKQFREPEASGIVISQLDRIAPSSYGRSSCLIRKKGQKKYLFAGDSTSNDLIWPETDKSEIQVWRLTVAIDGVAIVSGQNTKPLSQLKFVADVSWNTTTNQFSIQKA
jgi:hypothetical protein